MSGGLGIPQIDFSPLARLGETAAKGIRQNERRNALAALGVSPGDPNFLPKLGQTLVGLGDIEGALTVSRLQEASQDRAYQRTRDARDFAFREMESARQQGNADRAFTAGREDRNLERDRQASVDRLTNYYRDRADVRSDETLALQRQAATRREVPAGFEANPDSPGGFRPIGGGPQDPKYLAERKAAEASAAGEKALPAELGARVALAQSFLDGVPTLREQVKSGGVTGIWDATVARSGYGDQGEILRRIRSGSEAIIRNLTGAGMNQEEARARVAQYEPAVGDNAETVTRKLDMLTEQLQRIEAEAYRGRGIPANRRGKNPYFEEPAGSAQASNPRMVPLDQVPENARFRRDGKTYRRVNGQDVPE